MKMSSASPDNIFANLPARVSEAVCLYWSNSVRGGQQMRGFELIIRDILLAGGIQEHEIFYGSKLEIPGYFRPHKRWDILAVVEGKLVAAVEFKSQGGSVGKNYNNRVEEAVGSAKDLWTAYREEVIPATPRP